MSKQFVKFREYNDNEGESWNFWLQLDGNEAELEKMSANLEKFDSEGWYDLNLKDPIPESEVDILVKHSDSGYMMNENKITGTFTSPEINATDDDEGWEWITDNFYKGDIARHFSE